MSENKSDDQPETKPLGNLAVRLLTSAVAVPLLLYLLFLAPTWGFGLLVCAACLVAAIELFTITVPGRRLHQAIGVGLTLAVFAATTAASYLRIPEIPAPARSGRWDDPAGHSVPPDQ